MMKLLRGRGVCRCGVGVCNGWMEGPEGEGRYGSASRCPGHPLPSAAAMPPVRGAIQGNGVGRQGYTGVLWVDGCLQSMDGKVERMGVDMVQHHDVQTPPTPSQLPDRLVGLVFKASASRAEDPGFESHLRRDFSEVESYQ